MVITPLNCTEGGKCLKSREQSRLSEKTEVMKNAPRAVTCYILKLTSDEEC